MLAQVRAEGARAGRPSIFRPAPPRPALSEDPLDQRLSEELGTIRRRLEQLGSVLAQEPLLIHKHGAQLQSIDLMMQQLGHLAAVIASADKAQAAELVTLQDLRQRLNRKPIRAILG